MKVLDILWGIISPFAATLFAVMTQFIMLAGATAILIGPPYAVMHFGAPLLVEEGQKPSLWMLALWLVAMFLWFLILIFGTGLVIELRERWTLRKKR
jgi:hypothetical protein